MDCGKRQKKAFGESATTEVSAENALIENSHVDRILSFLKSYSPSIEWSQ